MKRRDVLKAALGAAAIIPATQSDRVTRKMYPSIADKEVPVRDLRVTLGEELGIDPERIRVTPSFLDPDDFNMYRAVYLDKDPKKKAMWNVECSMDHMAQEGREAAERVVLKGLVRQLRKFV